jgi:hypothetical protein
VFYPLILQFIKREGDGGAAAKTNLRNGPAAGCTNFSHCIDGQEAGDKCDLQIGSPVGATRRIKLCPSLGGNWGGIGVDSNGRHTRGGGDEPS